MALKPDDTVCYCFHVSLRKVQNFCRIRKPKVASQISECLSAGTGCGWCVRMLRHIHAEICGPEQRPWAQDNSPTPADPNSAPLPPDLSAETYAAARQQYLTQTGRQPPKPQT